MRMSDLRERLTNLESKYMELDQAFNVLKATEHKLHLKIEQLQKDHNELLGIVLKLQSCGNSGAKAVDIGECVGIEKEVPRTQGNANVCGLSAKFNRNTE